MNVLDWAREAELGMTVTYHESDKGITPREGWSALDASNRGLVFLSQRRKAPGSPVFEYRATRISNRTAQQLRLIEADGLGYRLVA